MSRSNPWQLRPLLVAAALALCAGASLEPAAAAPRYYRVVRVPVGKVVWIRSGPGWNFKKIGFLPSRARHIRSSGCKAFPADQWCRVKYRGTTGWAPRLNLARDTMRMAERGAMRDG